MLNPLQELGIPVLKTTVQHTGLESLIGYLYLTNRIQRILELLENR